jgi:hypothetical protein
MRTIRTTIIIPVIIIAITLPLIFFISCTKNTTSGLIIITEVPGKLQNMNFETGNNWRYLPQAQLVSIDPDDPEEPPVLLTGEFYSACSPSVSFDGRFVLFAAQQKQDDPWNIWEMNLGNLKVRKVISSAENCTDPAYLPDNRLLFSKLIPDDTLKSGHSLYTSNLDGSDQRRITFNPGTYFASAVLNDGRILTICRELYPEQGKELYLVLRPDGTKAELFFRSNDDKIVLCRARETQEGKIVFIESAGGGDNLVSIRYNRPLHSAAGLSNEINGQFRSVCPMNSGIMLVSLRKPEVERYAIYRFDPSTGSIGEALYATPDYDLLDAVAAEEHSIPRKLPSEVDMLVKTGLLLCQDINVLDPMMKSDRKASKIEVLGLNESYGRVDVEPDGSFYIKAMADTPFRLRSLDEKGNVIQGPCAWMSLRPNERRGCVGCHEDMEMAPENRVPLSVRKSPVKLPVHVEKIKEKTVELE